MTLREKIGQTAMPSPPAVRRGVLQEGGYVEYFKKYPYSGFYLATESMVKNDGSPLTESFELADIANQTAKELDIPLFIAADAEFGGGRHFKDMSLIPSNMSVGAANSPELAYKRGYYWAKELRSAGMNWAFGPVCDRLTSFFNSSGIRCISDDTQLIADLIPHMIRGIQDAGMLSTAKHYPGRISDYRDPHFSLCADNAPRAEWDRLSKPIWQAASDSGIDSFMTAHPTLPCLDNSYARGNTPRPASASKKVMNVLRNEIGFDGLIVTDAVSMKCLAAAFDHDDMYIECLNAGNDVILFTGNDYIDVIEKAVEQGKVSVERIEDAALKVLTYKTKLGLFDGKIIGAPMTDNDKADFEKVNYEISKIGATLIKNDAEKIPFDSSKIKKAAIIPIAPSERFHNEEIIAMTDALSAYGIESTVVHTIKSKTELKEISDSNQLIIYACFLSSAEPHGFAGYSQIREINTLFNGMSYGAEKSVVASFASHTIYYNYFEGVDTFINMYTSNKESMQAFVDGIFGKFQFKGKSPARLSPEII